MQAASPNPKPQVQLGARHCWLRVAWPGIALLWCVTLLSPVPLLADQAARAEPELQQELQSRETPQAPAAAAGARVSLRMRAAPLAQVLSVMQMTTALRFRYGAVPDEVVSIEADDAPLLPALQNVLKGRGWHLQPVDSDVFVLRHAQARHVQAPNAATSSAASSSVTPGVTPLASWEWWSGAQPPPRRWMALEEVEEPRAARSLVSRSAPARASASIADSPSAFSWLWRAAQVEVQAESRPGVGVFAPPPAANAWVQGSAVSALASPSPGVSRWLRWRLPLRFVPRGARLLLEVPEVPLQRAPATFYINGAPVARFSGLRMLDLSRALRRGVNVLAVHWPAAPQVAAPGAPGAASTSSASASSAERRPLLRYEWFFDAPGGAPPSR